MTKVWAVVYWTEGLVVDPIVTIFDSKIAAEECVSKLEPIDERKVKIEECTIFTSSTWT